MADGARGAARGAGRGVARRVAWMAVLLGLGVLLPLPRLPAGEVPAAGGSLAPVDTEAFRSRYGQEALFRLRLGVEAAAVAPGACDGPPRDWPESPEHQRFERALASGQWFGAGGELGRWQWRNRHCR